MPAALALLFAIVPHLLFAQPPAGTPRPQGATESCTHRLSLQLAAGSTIQGGGSVQAVSIGYSPSARLTLLLSAERQFLPTRVQYFENGSSATRGGTLQLVNAELRIALLQRAGPSPYVLVGMGRGVSRPNVNDIFPDRVSNAARSMFCGGGIRVPLGIHASLFADARVNIFTEREDAGMSLPVRGGLAWRF
jgi:hypothetical protein